MSLDWNTWYGFLLEVFCDANKKKLSDVLGDMQSWASNTVLIFCDYTTMDCFDELYGMYMALMTFAEASWWWALASPDDGCQPSLPRWHLGRRAKADGCVLTLQMTMSDGVSHDRLGCGVSCEINVAWTAIKRTNDAHVMLLSLKGSPNILSIATQKPWQQ